MLCLISPWICLSCFIDLHLLLNQNEVKTTFSQRSAPLGALWRKTEGLNSHQCASFTAWGSSVCPLFPRVSSSFSFRTLSPIDMQIYYTLWLLDLDLLDYYLAVIDTISIFAGRTGKIYKGTRSTVSTVAMGYWLSSSISGISLLEDKASYRLPSFWLLIVDFFLKYNFLFQLWSWAFAWTLGKIFGFYNWEIKLRYFSAHGNSIMFFTFLHFS